MQVELVNIGKRFQKKWLFQNQNWVFKSNEIIGITGNNGSGKSTITQLVSGYLTPSQGEIHWSENQVISIEEIWNYVSWCSPLIDIPGTLSVSEIFAFQFSMRPSFNTRLEDVLDQIQLKEHAGKKLEDLSSGMLQRVKLMLAFNTKSKILILDEPCSHLDEHWQNWMDQQLVKSAHDRLVLIASNEHPMELKRCTRFLNINPNGQILEGR